MPDVQRGRSGAGLGCDHEPSEAANAKGETVCMDCGTTLHDYLTVTLRRDDMQRVYELAVARAVSIEGAETEARFPLGSEAFRRPADAIRAALAGGPRPNGGPVEVVPARQPIPGLVAGSELVHIEGLETEVARLRHGLALIVQESEQFPTEDGIGAGTMARNLLADHS